MKLKHFGIGSQSMIPAPPASAPPASVSPGSLLEMQIVAPHPRPVESESLGIIPRSVFFLTSFQMILTYAQV